MSTQQFVSVLELRRVFYFSLFFLFVFLCFLDGLSLVKGKEIWIVCGIAGVGDVTERSVMDVKGEGEDGIVCGIADVGDVTERSVVDVFLFVFVLFLFFSLLLRT